MMTTIPVPGVTPLERFVREYVDSIGGAWDIVEPDVYDVLVPLDSGASAVDDAGRGIVRIAFDPEALPEHASAQLASFGAPLIDRWLEDAMRRGRTAQAHLVGLNLSPHDLTGRVRRALTLAPGLEITIERVRPLEFPQAIFWFQATFASDQKEQEIVPLAIDLHYLRQTRQLEQLLDPARLAEQPAQRLAEVRRASLVAAYPIARDRVLRTFIAMANGRCRELNERTERQVARMTQYYADLRSELAEQRDRALSRDPNAADHTKFANRLEALSREETLRISELRSKSTLQVHLRLLNVLVVQQPKLLIRAVLATNAPQPVGPPRRIEVKRAVAPHTPTPIELVWDPLVEVIEAPPCPVCKRPSYAFSVLRFGSAACTDCAPAGRSQ
jgi:hypothetical protein